VTDPIESNARVGFQGDYIEGTVYLHKCARSPGWCPIQTAK
jgi:hypothetical protein